MSGKLYNFTCEILYPLKKNKLVRHEIYMIESRNNIRLKYEIMAEADKGELFMKLWGDLHESLS
jgi:hypothetical protein